VLASVDTLADALDVWRQQPEPNLTSEIWQAAADLFEITRTTEVEPSARQLVLAIDAFVAELALWREQNDLPATPPEYIGGHSALWRAWEMTQVRREPPRRLPNLEPISALESQGLSSRMIAKVYGWKTAEGTPDERRVIKARAEKSAEYAEGIANPAQDEIDAKLAAAWSDRVVANPKVIATQSTPPIAPETLDELIEQQVSVAQIIKLKPELTEEDVLARAVELEIEIPHTMGEII